MWGKIAYSQSVYLKPLYIEKCNVHIAYNMLDTAYEYKTQQWYPNGANIFFLSLFNKRAHGIYKY